MMSKDDLQELIWQSTVPLSSDCPEEIGEVVNKLQEYLGRFDTLDGKKKQNAIGDRSEFLKAKCE